MAEDNAHRLSVTVTPLQPPFRGRVRFYRFENGTKQLAVSDVDGLAIDMLISGSPVGRSLVLEDAGDEQVRVTVVQ